MLVTPRVEFADWALQTVLTQSFPSSPAAAAPTVASPGDEETAALHLSLCGGVEGYIGWFRRLVRCAASTK